MEYNYGDLLAKRVFEDHSDFNQSYQETSLPHMYMRNEIILRNLQMPDQN